MRKFSGAAVLAALLVVVGLITAERVWSCTVATTIHSPPGTTCLAANMVGNTTVSALESNAVLKNGFDASGTMEEFAATRTSDIPTGAGEGSNVTAISSATLAAYAVNDYSRDGTDELNIFRSPPAANMLAVTVSQSAAITTSDLRLDGFANIAGWPMQEKAAAISQTEAMMPEVITSPRNNDASQYLTLRIDAVRHATTIAPNFNGASSVLRI